MPETMLTGEELIEVGDTYFLSDDREDNSTDVLQRIEKQIKRLVDIFEQAVKETRLDWKPPS
jgi:hypothetical protein